MENKETICTLKAISEKESKAGRKYYQLETDKGIITAFDEPIVAEIKKFIGKKVRLEVAENDKGFVNLRKFLGEISEEKVPQMYVPENLGSRLDEFDVARKLKDTSIYTSYAKDIFLALCEHEFIQRTEKGQGGQSNEYNMKDAIALVKQAREAFK